MWEICVSAAKIMFYILEHIRKPEVYKICEEFLIFEKQKIPKMLTMKKDFAKR